MCDVYYSGNVEIKLFEVIKRGVYMDTTFSEQEQKMLKEIHDYASDKLEKAGKTYEELDAWFLEVKQLMESPNRIILVVPPIDITINMFLLGKTPSAFAEDFTVRKDSFV